MIMGMTKALEEMRKAKKYAGDCGQYEENGTDAGAEINFMGGISYGTGALTTLKLVSASSIFGEPQYYRDGEFAEKSVKDGTFRTNNLFEDYLCDGFNAFRGMKTSEVMEKVIDDALSEDFKGVLDWAVTLRNEYNMRLNPQIIMVRAGMHEDRVKFTKANPGLFNEYEQKVMLRADDVISQATYYLYRNDGKKNNIPNILKRAWKANIEKMSSYSVAKYRTHGIGLIDTVRLSHASSPVVNELMKNGKVEVSENELTWENLRSKGSSWEEILEKVNMGHMALLRNLRGILNECGADEKLLDDVSERLKAGVKTGKQFPFRYYSAYRAVDRTDNKSAYLGKLKDTLEECMDISCDNLPKLKGNNAFLSDNSGSAWGTCTSEYGTVTIGSINNLSAVIGAVNSDNGTVFTFGDRLISHSVSKRNGILSQAETIDADRNKVGGSTENGIWLFFDEAIKKRTVYDNIFIYSDEQAGHGGLYGTHECYEEYDRQGFSVCHGSKHIDVAKLADTYRREVNPKVNIFCVQTAGYTNVLLPENGYRTSILYGWTGKELLYADAVNKVWDETDRQKKLSRTVELHDPEVERD